MKNWLKFRLTDGISVDRALMWVILIVLALGCLVLWLRSLPAPSMPVYHAGVPNTIILDVEPPTGENLDARGYLPELPANRENRWLKEAQDQDNGNHKSDTIDKDH